MKEKGGRFLENTSFTHPVEPFKGSAPSRLLAMRILIANCAHSSVSGLLSTTYSCWWQHYEKIWNLLPMEQWKFETHNAAFLCRLGRSESSVKLATARWCLYIVHWTDSAVRPALIHYDFPIPTARWISSSRRQSGLPTAIRGVVESLKVSQRMGRAKLLNISAPLSLIKSFRMRLLLVRSISLDCTFN